MIDKLTLRNFKAFDYISLSLGSLNLLAGLNSTGKSTVLQSLLLLKQTYGVYSGNNLKLNGTLTSLGQTNDVLYEKATDDVVEISVAVDNKTMNLRYKYSPDVSEFESSRKRFPLDKLQVLANSVRYIAAGRISPAQVFDLSGIGKSEERDFGTDGRFAISYLNEHFNESIGHRYLLLEEEDKTLATQTNLWMQFISPDVRIEPKVDRKAQTAELNFSFEEGDHSTKAYKSTNVGYGLTNILPIVVQVLSAQKGETLLFENPEAHIHPAGQTKLGELFARAAADGIQIIVETHSDHIINGVRLAAVNHLIDENRTRIFYFYRDEEDDYRHKAMDLKLTGTGQLNHWPDGFLDEWDKNLTQLVLGG